MNIFLHEWRMIRKFTISWSIAFVLLISLFLSFFPAIAKEVEEFTKLLEGFPEEVRLALGIQIESIGTILGYYSYTFVYILLCGAIQAMILGVSMGSNESRQKTAEFLFAKPVKRKQVLLAKVLAGLTSIVITNLIFYTSALFVATVVSENDLPVKTFLMISLSLLFMQVIFLSIGFFLSTILTKIKSVIAVSLGTVFAFFIISMISATGEEIWKRFLSPFSYFDSTHIIEHTSYEWPFIITGLIVVILSFISSFILFKKKDIRI
ncbi:ABC transporter permease subunit [Bacillus carboniphilus]|uniref:ABC transporter permease subunit n=1 Tax=Bacillus carboniphilus TaxID=86663 RepID=A0ABY9JPP0_9BACI|nr:ABC transporter permease subunit [Bacillus carboniphilus]WLR41379.1 ABC transporter permease subunit [Bacillus carboniphilus]